MIYINAKRLVDAAVKNKIIKTTQPGMQGYDPKTKMVTELEEGTLLIYLSAGENPDYPEGWYARSNEEVIHMLMPDEHGQKIIADALIELGELPEFMDESEFDSENANQDFIEFLTNRAITKRKEENIYG